MKKSWNRILDNNDRNDYAELIGDMFSLMPQEMNRKIGMANVQQSFTIKAVKDFYEDNDKVLCVGAYEDTSYEYLSRRGMRIVAIDPVLNVNLHTFATSSEPSSYNIIFSCSVIEHTHDDMEFIRDIINLLRPGGIGILTCDFKNNWKQGDRVPFTSNRFYTEQDLQGRFKDLLEEHKCHYVDTPRWSNQKYEFEWEGIRYDFATMVFRKERNANGRNSDSEQIRPSTDSFTDSGSWVGQAG
jgi:SAM-dependent methyltransferase